MRINFAIAGKRDFEFGIAQEWQKLDHLGREGNILGEIDSLDGGAKIIFTAHPTGTPVALCWWDGIGQKWANSGVEEGKYLNLLLRGSQPFLAGSM